MTQRGHERATRRWKLTNAEERSKRAPKTFKIPPREVREGLRFGDYAKLCFLRADGSVSSSGANGDRMWVRVAGATLEDGKRRYRGVLHNEPTSIPDLKHGDILHFGAEHVLNVQQL